MFIFDEIWDGLKAIGHLFKRIMRIPIVKDYAKEWLKTVDQIVGFLLLDTTTHGSSKLKQVLSIIQNMAAKQGKEAVDALSRWLVELKLAHHYGDDVDALLSAGLEPAKAAVAKLMTDVGVKGVSFESAAAELKVSLEAAGKAEIAVVSRHLNLLIAAAIAELTAEGSTDL